MYQPSKDQPMSAEPSAVPDPLAEQFLDPYPVLARARREEPVFYSPAYDAWAVCRYEDIQQILRDPVGFSSRNAIPPIFKPSPAAAAELAKGYPTLPVPTTADGELHRRLRVPFSRALSHQRVSALVPWIRQEVHALIDTFAQDGHAEFMDQFAKPLPLAVIARVCGMDPEDIPTIAEGGAGTEALSAAPLSDPEQVQAARCVVVLQRLVARYVRQRRAAPRGDLISEVVTTLAPGDGPLSFEQESELVSNVCEALVAGHITTTPLLGNGLRLLLEHPEQWGLLRDRPELINDAVTEVVRVGAPVPAMFRMATQDVTVAGRQFPPGTQFAIMFGSANRDETRFGSPERFDITAQPRDRHMSFGFGAHYCVGAGLARVQLEIAVTALLQRLPTMRLTAGQVLTNKRVHLLLSPVTLRVEW
jgi:cytochrome P450